MLGKSKRAVNVIGPLPKFLIGVILTFPLIFVGYFASCQRTITDNFCQFTITNNSRVNYIITGEFNFGESTMFANIPCSFSTPAGTVFVNHCFHDNFTCYFNNLFVSAGGYVCMDSFWTSRPIGAPILQITSVDTAFAYANLSWRSTNGTKPRSNFDANGELVPLQGAQGSGVQPLGSIIPTNISNIFPQLIFSFQLNTGTNNLTIPPPPSSSSSSLPSISGASPDPGNGGSGSLPLPAPAPAPNPNPSPNPATAPTSGNPPPPADTNSADEQIKALQNFDPTKGGIKIAAKGSLDDFWTGGDIPGNQASGNNSAQSSQPGKPDAFWSDNVNTAPPAGSAGDNPTGANTGSSNSSNYGSNNIGNNNSNTSSDQVNSIGSMVNQNNSSGNTDGDNSGTDNSDDIKMLEELKGKISGIENSLPADAKGMFEKAMSPAMNIINGEIQSDEQQNSQTPGNGYTGTGNDAGNNNDGNNNTNSDGNGGLSGMPLDSAQNTNQPDNPPAGSDFWGNSTAPSDSPSGTNPAPPPADTGSPPNNNQLKREH